MVRLLMVSFISLGVGLLGVPAYAAETLSDREMDQVVAGFLDAEVNLTVNASANATSGDGGISTAGTTGGGNGLASVPVNNALVVKGVGGDVAAAHNGATATVDNSDNSDNSGQIHVQAGGDSAAAHSGGVATVDNSDNSVTTLVGGAWTATGHGNQGDVLVANDSSTVDVDNTLGLSDQAQQNVNALFLVNTLSQVGSGFNLVSTVNESGGGLIGNVNSGAIVTNQTVLNFSTLTTGSQTITVSPSGSSVGGS